jgi:hypothetical protein
MRKLDELIKEVTQKSRFLGHRLAGFEKHGNSEAYSSCLRCNRVVGVAASPQKNGSHFLGDLLDHRCEAGTKTPRPVPVFPRSRNAPNEGPLSLGQVEQNLLDLALAHARRAVSQKSGDKVVPLSSKKASKRAPASPKPGDVIMQPRSVEYKNRKGLTYFLHKGKTKTGRDRYYFSTKNTGELCSEVPEGYEIYEHPDSKVFLRKIQPRLILPEELETLERALKRHGSPGQYRIDERGNIVTVFWSEEPSDLVDDLLPFGELFAFKGLRENYRVYQPLMRFVLVDAEKRLFIVERFCFRGSIDDWMTIYGGGGPDSLNFLARKFVPHLGEEAFYELI